MKGTDQLGSLAIVGIYRMVRDIRNLELSLGYEDIFIDDNVKSASVKLERSIATNKALEAGDIINESDIHLLSPGNGFKWSEKNNVIGKKVLKAIPKNEIIYNDLII